VKTLRQHWPVLIAVTVFWLVLLVLLKVCLGQNQGHFVYALDDGYVQIAIAKNFTRVGVWGVTSHGFTSATSSILWPLLLSAIYLPFGVREIAPFILNILFATLVVIAADRILRQFPLTAVYRLLLLFAVIFLAPLPTLVFAGMEHTAQIFFDIAFVFVSAELLANQHFSWRDRNALMLLALAPLVTSIRYEGLFIVFVVCVLFLVRRRTRFALVAGLFALLPIGIYGLISVKHGAPWLPNSLLLKGVMPLTPSVGMLSVITQKFLVAPHLPLLLVLAACLYLFGSWHAREKWDQDLCLLLILLGSAVLHLSLAGVGWFYRYEAYLVVLGILVNAKLLWRTWLTWKDRKRLRGPGFSIAVGAVSILLIATTFALGKRGVQALRETAQATTNIYEQQYQMATFVRDYYQGTSVLANDVGAINVLADINCVDVWGLANTAVARAKLANTYSSAMVNAMAKASNARIAIVYDEWLDPYGGVPSQWIKVGEWRITNNVICASDKISFYAVDAAEIGKLRANLTAFAPRLPPTVIKRTLEFPLFPLGTRLDLTQRDADQYLIQGWSTNERAVRWSDKRTAFIVFGLTEVHALSLRIKLTPFLVPGKLEAQQMNVMLNDQPVASLSLKGTGEYIVTLPGNVVHEKNVIEFEFPDAASPASLGLNNDARLFGVNVEWIEITSAVEK
jgi:hypothetical protein